MSPKRSALTLIALLLLVFGVAALGGAATSSGLQGWYGSLDKPAWTPPRWAFGPVWTVLYAAMAVAAWDLIRKGGRAARLPLVLWGVQLVLNGLWSPLFFGIHALGPALLVLILMWGAVAGVIATSWRHSRLAAVLLAPYLAWLTLAGSLNAWILVHN